MLNPKISVFIKVFAYKIIHEYFTKVPYRLLKFKFPYRPKFITEKFSLRCVKIGYLPFNVDSSVVPFYV